MRIGHISDLHWLDLSGASPSDFLNKRLSGGFNLLAGRARKYTHKVVREALETLKSLGCDHLVVTGDLTNLALPSEFRSVKEELSRYFSKDNMTIVPGNHDVYTHESAAARRFEAYFCTPSQGNLDIGTATAWPFVQLKDDIAFIGLNSARPKPWFVASGVLGSRQLRDLRNALKHPEVASRFKIIAIHHHPIRTIHAPGESIRDLKDRQQLLDICEEFNVDMCLHGHNHTFSIRRHAGTLVLDPGSAAIEKSATKTGYGKFNLYHIQNAALQSIDTYLFSHDRFSLWKTTLPSDLPPS
ncbi:MAG: metallophosphoesterase [Proteobacteria bacterium]|nr:metallophosphoesterase [Pseudomonadota bacterium]